MLSVGGSANASAERGGYNGFAKLLWPRRGCWFLSFLFPTLWVSLRLAVIGWGRGAAVLRLLLLLLRGRLTICPLPSFSLTACFTGGPASRWRSNRLTKSGRLTTAAWPVFTCGHRR